MTFLSKSYFSKFILAGAVLAACFLAPLSAHALIMAGAPVPPDLANCQLQTTDHAATGPHSYFVSVSFQCQRPVDELAATLAVENYVKDIIRADVESKGGLCHIVNSSLHDDLLTRGLPGEEMVRPDQTRITYHADVECEPIEHPHVTKAVYTPPPIKHHVHARKTEAAHAVIKRSSERHHHHRAKVVQVKTTTTVTTTVAPTTPAPLPNAVPALPLAHQPASNGAITVMPPSLATVPVQNSGSPLPQQQDAHP